MSEWPAADVAQFRAGLTWVAWCYMEQQTPALSMPTGEPWAAIAAALMGVPPGDIENEIALGIAQYQPATQAALFQAIMARSDMLQSVATRKPGPQQRVDSKALLQLLSDGGYSFRTNALTERIEVNGQPMSDATRNGLRVYLRDSMGCGDATLEFAEESWSVESERNRFHPVREWLQGLSYNGGAYIANLAAYFTDKHQHFGLLLRRWLIAAVARAYTGVQVPVLVLEGGQGLGKSYFCHWLAPCGAFFTEGGIDPDSKDCQMRACSKWLWEVSELGATTLRRDQAALKFFLSAETFTYRRPYGKFDIDARALACYIATANDAGGLLTDTTGNRRYWTVALTGIDWAYSQCCDSRSVWGEAHAAYLAGEPYRLTPDEQIEVATVNETFEVDDPTENLLRRTFNIDPHQSGWWLSSADVLTGLQTAGARGHDQMLSNRIGAALKKLGCERVKRAGVRGYCGIRN